MANAPLQIAISYRRSQPDRAASVEASGNGAAEGGVRRSPARD